MCLNIVLEENMNRSLYVVFLDIDSLIIDGYAVSHSRLMTGNSVAYAACVRKQVQPMLSSHVEGL